jgi:hypothetical protein
MKYRIDLRCGCWILLTPQKSYLSCCKVHDKENAKIKDILPNIITDIKSDEKDS